VGSQKFIDETFIARFPKGSPVDAYFKSGTGTKPGYGGYFFVSGLMSGF
jgi:hypothetical protein